MTSFNKDITFGTIIGMLYILTSLLFYFTGKNININPQLNQTLTLLMMTGVFLGGRIYRNEYGISRFGFKKAYKVVITMILISTLIYCFYIYILYSSNTNLVNGYIMLVENTFRELYATSPMLDPMLAILKNYTNPVIIAFTEFINKMFSGIIFAIFIALILRNKTIVKKTVYNDNE